jgi:hypothetical protein
MTARYDRPLLPPRKTLIRFFGGDRRPVSLDLAAQLLGFSEQWVRARVSSESLLLPGEHVPWEDVMHWFLSVWPRDTIVTRLRPDADVLLPRGLHLRTVRWRLPAYLVAAIETQAALDRHSELDRHDATVNGYLVGQLHNIIEDATVAALAADEDFLAAFYYPAVPEGAP